VEAVAAAAAKRKAEAEAEEARKMAEAQQQTSQEIYVSREDLLKHREQRTRELEEKAKKIEASAKLEHAVETKSRTAYAGMFDESGANDRTNKSKIWLALNPQPLAFQTAQDRREKEETIRQVGMPGGRNFNAMRDILSNTIEEVEEEQVTEAANVELDESNEYSNPTADGDSGIAEEIVSDEEEEEEEEEEDEDEDEDRPLTADEIKAEFAADQALFAMLDTNRAQREVEEKEHRAKLKLEYAAAAKKKQEELDRELAVIAEEKRLEKIEKEIEKEAAVADAQARVSELTFDFSW
jgi:hypothetical protein